MSATARPYVRLHDTDDVGLALRDLPAATEIVADLTLTGPVPRGHKFAPHGIAEGQEVRRYDQIIGEAAAPIAAGDHRHVHNLRKSQRAARPPAAAAARAIATEALTFQGYRRPDVRVGIRNHIGVLTTASCSGSVASLIAEAAERAGLLSEFPDVDGIVPLAHGSGCGMPMSGFKPLPGLKLSSNPELAARMPGDFDLDGGDIVSAGVSVETKGRAILRLMLEVASGARTKSERLGFGGVEFVPRQIGAAM